MNPEVESRVEEFLARCREGGIRVTPQRTQIFRALITGGGHPSAEDIYAHLRADLPGLSVDTVYRTLGTLQELGIVQRLEVLDDRGRFEANTHPHHHLICVRCRRIEDVEWAALDALPLPPQAGKWGKVDRPHAELRGICRECRTADQDALP